MADSNQQPIVVVKRKKVVAGGGHHGGAWKVAMSSLPFGLRGALRRQTGAFPRP